MQKMTAAKSKAFHVSKLLSKLPRKQTTHYLERSSINQSLRCGIVSTSANSSYHFKGLDRMIPRQQQQHHVIFDRSRLTLRSDSAVSCFSVLLTNGLQPHHFRPTSVNFSQIRAYSSESENDDRDDRPQKQSRRPFKLMDFQEIIWPSPFRTIRNYFFSFLISTYFDRTFSLKGFLGGGAQAVQFVSGRLAEGEFDSLDGMVSTEALEEIQNNYADLSYTQKRSLAVRAEDLYIKFVYEIGMIFDDDTNQRFVEITAVFQGFPGFRDLYEQTGPEYYQHIMENQDKVFVCNYRFIREFTKGVESDWTINKLNHFSPLDVPVKF